MPQASTLPTQWHSNLHVHLSNPAPHPSPTIPPHLLLLHGFLSSHTDLLSLATSLHSLNLPVIVPDIPLHGSSRRLRPKSLPHTARILALALADMFPASQDAPVKLIIVGYSMGGRLAMEFVNLLQGDNFAFTVIGLVLISSAMPPRSIEEVVEWRHKGAEIAESIENVVGELAFKDWLEQWYARPMWGQLKNCVGYAAMLQRKLSTFDSARVEEWATAARVMADYDNPLAGKIRVPAMYVYGALDEKYKRVAHSVTETFMQCSAVQVTGAGHHIVLERGAELGKLITSFATDVLKRYAPVVKIGRLYQMEYSLGLRRQMTVGGKRLKSREGVLVVVESTDGVRGVGDICPLPGLHEEPIQICLNEAQVASRRLIGVVFTTESTSLQELEQVLNCFSHVSRCGLAAAILHMISRAWYMSLRSVLTILVSNNSCSELVGISDLFGHVEQVEVNGVLPRLQKSERNNALVRTGDSDFQNFSKISPFRTLKLKVGITNSPFQEGADCGEAAAQAGDRGQQVRLDANRAWTKMEFRNFVDGLTQVSADIEFIEEPLSSMDELMTYLEEESTSSRSTDKHFGLNIALDESLRESSLEVIQKLAAFQCVSALVIKPAVIGSISRVLKLFKAARESSCQVVMSTIFESGVGIAWTALLASVLGTEGTCHGLGTYRYLTRDVTEVSFQAVCILGTLQRVSIRKCWQFLDQAAENVVKSCKD
eukprot:GFKZ01004125.1.p1 GENE.GFKZ01004125.1~~GFKZ01004125.1.p1  ORF type:complete len:713 (-),score=58.85 GFKZ01004125.1:200-2338(-)